jgi:hypothetical protein
MLMSVLKHIWKMTYCWERIYWLGFITAEDEEEICYLCVKRMARNQVNEIKLRKRKIMLTIWKLHIYLDKPKNKYPLEGGWYIY